MPTWLDEEIFRHEKDAKVANAESSIGYSDCVYDYKELINMRTYIQLVVSCILSIHAVVGQPLVYLKQWSFTGAK